MIESIGITEDGKIWMNLKFEHNNQVGILNIQMTPEQANDLCMNLAAAISEAQQIVTQGVSYERNSANLN